MKRTLPLFSLTLSLILILCSCMGGIASVKVTCDSFYNQHHHTGTVTLDKGGTMAVTLCSNPTTGFQWNDKPYIGNTSIVKQESHEYKEPDTELPGAAGTEIWKFSAENPGKTSIMFEYSQL